MTLKIHHKDCGYYRTYENICPNCHLPFCEEDAEQSTSGSMMTMVVAAKKADDLQSDVEEIKTQLTSISASLVTIIAQLNELTTNFNSLYNYSHGCKNYKPPH